MTMTSGARFVLVAILLLARPVAAGAQGLSGYAVGGVGGGPDEGSLAFR